MKKIGIKAALLLLSACFSALILPKIPAFAQPPGVEYKSESVDKDGIPAERYKERRAKMLASLGQKTAYILVSADVRNRQNDVDYEYRQESNLLYLTGIAESGTTLLLVPGGARLDSAGTAKYSEILFVQKRNSAREMWTGVQLGIERAGAISGVEKVMENSKLKEVLEKVLAERDTLLVCSWPTPSIQDPLFGERVYMDKISKKTLEEKFPKLTVRTQKSLLTKMREIKDADEIRLLQRAIDISIEGHKAAMRSAKSGMAEFELEAVMEYTFHRLGAEDLGYPSISGAGHNACILHYTANRRAAKNNELVLMDCGAEYHGYTADITRTFPINGKFSPEQKILYNITLAAADSAISAARAGNNFNEPHKRAMRVITEELKKLQIISSDEEVRYYFPHGTSHYLGLDVHDVGNYGKLTKGQVITVEPGIYIPEGSPCDKKWWNIGIRIEDDILISDGEPMNMSKALPRTIEDIERLMKK